MKKLWSKLKGWKTYGIAATMVVYAVVVVGFHGGDWASAGKLILEAMAMAGLRNAI